MNKHTYLIAAASFALLTANAPLLAKNDSRQPRYAPAFVNEAANSHPMELKNVPDFAADNGQPTASPAGATQRIGQPVAGTALQAGAASTTLPVQTRLTLVLECPVDAKTSQPGDVFEAHVKDDLFIGTQLLLPKGSLVRGRVVEVKKPGLISRAAHIGLKLEQIDTPLGEVIPLDAALEFRKGVSNAKGQLDPGTSFGTRVEGGLKTVTGMNSTGATRGALVAANIATLGAPAAATLIGGSAIALFRSGDNVSLSPGQELEVLLTNDLGLQIE